jgi:lipoyl(octanoyl) transferase
MSMSIVCRVLPYENADGPANMALDEALLDLVSGGVRTAYLRTYGWTIPTLSLGYFQKLAEARSDPRWSDVALVRRPTGGGAIWHHHEVTYALVIPGVHPLGHPNTELYRAVHLAIADVLVGLGVHAGRRGDGGVQTLYKRERPLLCFTDRSPEDIVTRGIKLVGSAQRRRVDAVLQHGSILLEQSWHTPELPGVRDVAGVDAEPREWSGRLAAAIPGALGLEPVAANVPDEVRERAADLERSVYRSSTWTARR